MLAMSDTSKTILSGSTGRGAFLYAVRSGDHIKIGRAQNVEKRLASLRTGSPTPISLVHCVGIHPDLISEAEKLAHKMHGDRRVRGEWFAISDRDAGTCLDAIAAQMARHEAYLDWKPSLGPDPAFSALELALKVARGEPLSREERAEVERIVDPLPSRKNRSAGI